MRDLRGKPYCRRLEDRSGYVVVAPKIKETSLYMQVNHNASPTFVDPKWEIVLGLGSSPRAAWKDFRKVA